MIILPYACLEKVSVAQVRPQCQTVSYTFVRLINTALAFFLTLEKLLVFCGNGTATVDRNDSRSKRQKFETTIDLLM